MATYSEPGIFNVLDPWVNIGGTDYGMVAGPVSAAMAEQNAIVLQGIINLAQEACAASPAFSATILFPGHSVIPPPVGSGGTENGAEYHLAVPSSMTMAPFFAVVLDCNWPLRFLGTGNVRLMMVGNSESTPVWGDMFFVQTNTSMDADIGGITFEDLELRYNADAAATGSAVHVAVGNTDTPYTNNGGQNVRLLRVIFLDCPIGAWFEKALQPSMLHCTGVWSNNVGVAVALGGTNVSGDVKPPAAIEAHIAFCTFRVPSGGVAGSTAMQVFSAEHLRVDNVRMEGFSYGIQIVPPPNGWNVVRCHFSDVSCYVGLTPGGLIGTSLLIQTSPSEENASLISQLVFTACEFEPGDSRTSSDQATGPGIFINQASGTIIETVRFVSCYTCRFPGPGMQISGGRHIEVLGGMYSGNNLGGATYPCGIYATNVNGLRIVGVNCNGQYEFINLSGGGYSASPKQAYGIYDSRLLLEDCLYGKTGYFSIGAPCSGGEPPR